MGQESPRPCWEVFAFKVFGVKKGYNRDGRFKDDNTSSSKWRINSPSEWTTRDVSLTYQRGRNWNLFLDWPHLGGGLVCRHLGMCPHTQAPLTFWWIRWPGHGTDTGKKAASKDQVRNSGFTLFFRGQIASTYWAPDGTYVKKRTLNYMLSETTLDLRINDVISKVHTSVSSKTYSKFDKIHSGNEFTCVLI